MKRLIPSLILLLLLCACSSDPPPESIRSTAASQWHPPLILSDEARSISDALARCAAFADEMNQLYPGYAPMLSEQDIAYFESRCADPESDLSALSAELAQTIVSFRQQIYLHMESTTKLGKSLPDGLEQYVRNFEAELRENGW